MIYTETKEGFKRLYIVPATEEYKKLNMEEFKEELSKYLLAKRRPVCYPDVVKYQAQCNKILAEYLEVMNNEIAKEETDAVIYNLNDEFQIVHDTLGTIEIKKRFIYR